MITRKNQFLLRFSKIRVIVNGKVIYPLEKDKPVVVPLSANHPQIVVTDGFHISKPVEVAYQHMHVHYLKVCCVIDDDQLVFGFMMLALFYTAGLTSDLIILKLMSFIPLVYFLFAYYINRQAFIQVKPA